MLVNWDAIYASLGIKDYIYFISSPAIQDELLPAKVVFIGFAMFFFCVVVYFYVNSSYLKYQFLQDTTEFFSWQSYDVRNVNKRWKKIEKRIQSGSENEYKLAIIEADDFLHEILKERGAAGKKFEELVNSLDKRILPNAQNILLVHEIRNAIVYDPDYALDLEKAREILSQYEKAIKGVAGA